MPVVYPCLIRSQRTSGEVVVRLGVPLVDDYLEFVEGRCRPNTVLAAAYDLKLFFTVVAKDPHGVVAADVLGFITAQRTGRGDAGLVHAVGVDGEPAGVATSTIARRLSSISGFFAYLQARGDVAANPVPRGLPTRRERSRPGQGVPLTRRVRRLPRILSPAEVDALTGALQVHLRVSEFRRRDSELEVDPVADGHLAGLQGRLLARVPVLAVDAGGVPGNRPAGC